MSTRRNTERRKQRAGRKIRGQRVGRWGNMTLIDRGRQGLKEMKQINEMRYQTRRERGRQREYNCGSQWGAHLYPPSEPASHSVSPSTSPLLPQRLWTALIIYDQWTCASLHLSAPTPVTHPPSFLAILLCKVQRHRDGNCNSPRLTGIPTVTSTHALLTFRWQC